MNTFLMHSYTESFSKVKKERRKKKKKKAVKTVCKNLCIKVTKLYKTGQLNS